jgi:hypothetical protein
MSTRWQRIGENLIAIAIASGVAAATCAGSVYYHRWREQQLIDKRTPSRSELLERCRSRDQKKIDRQQAERRANA